FAGSSNADSLSNEALVLGQALDVGLNQLIDLFTVRGIYLLTAMRRAEGIAYLSEAARLAAQADDNMRVGASLLNMADALAMTDPTAAVEAARTGAKHLRRAGERMFLAYTIGNLTRALIHLGDWHAAEQELTHAVESDGLGDIEYFTCYQGWLA